MQSVLIIGIDPQSIDYSTANNPPGMAAEKLAAEVEESRRQFSERGDKADLCTIELDDTAGGWVSQQLARSQYDGILIGGGLRPDSSISVLEHIINLVHQHAPPAAIAFLKLPRDAVAGAAQVLSPKFKDAVLLSVHRR